MCYECGFKPTGLRSRLCQVLKKQLTNVLIEIRGPESFEGIVKNARETERSYGHVAASKELLEVIADLSRRPTPDPTGATQRAMVSLECVARQVTGDIKSNLGDIMKRHGTIIPAPYWIRR